MPWREDAIDMGTGDERLRNGLLLPKLCLLNWRNVWSVKPTARHCPLTIHFFVCLIRTMQAFGESSERANTEVHCLSIRHERHRLVTRMHACILWIVRIGASPGFQIRFRIHIAFRFQGNTDITADTGDEHDRGRAGSTSAVRRAFVTGSAANCAHGLAQHDVHMAVRCGIDFYRLSPAFLLDGDRQSA